MRAHSFEPYTNRILFLSRSFYFDTYNGASIATRCQLETLARRGFSVHAFTGLIVDGGPEESLSDWAARHIENGTSSAVSGPLRIALEPFAGRIPGATRVRHEGLQIDFVGGALRKHHDPDRAEAEEFLPRFQALLNEFCPHMLLTFGGDGLTRECIRRAKAYGCATVFALHNFFYREPSRFNDLDAVVVPSRYAADHYRDALGLDCRVLPILCDPDRVISPVRDPRYVTFVNPSLEKGVYVFARIAWELGKRRPDIPFLVVESRGVEQTLANCGLDLRSLGNVSIMGHTEDPSEFWRVTRLCVVPSLFWESHGLVASEAMMNGIPVIASDRGALPETLGPAGVILSIPERITPATRILPDAGEVEPWIQAILELWDNPVEYEEQCERSLVRASHWDSRVLGDEHARFFHEVKLHAAGEHRRSILIQPGAARVSVVLVPYHRYIESPCEASLRALERWGVKVARMEGCSQIDYARSVMISDALNDGFESMLFIDADIGFSASDAMRLLAHPGPVVCGVYAKKGRRELSCLFDHGVDEVLFGPHAAGLYPLKYAATGFLRVKAWVLRKLIADLAPPLCKAESGRGFWPFFLPLCVPDPEGGHRYLGEDWSFSHRLARIGITPMADTSIRLRHYGTYGFAWEDAGGELTRHESYLYRQSNEEDA